MKSILKPLALCHLLSAICYSTSAQGTAFTYQGRLNDSSNPANGSYDLRFALFDAVTAGAQQANAVTNSSTAVSNGLFTVTLDFGNQFPGPARWLEIGVRGNGAGTFTTLVPRQALTATPYAIYAPNAGTAASAGSVAGANITGTIPLAQLPATLVTNGASGVSFSGTFSGNGGGVTNVNLRNISDQGIFSWSTNWGKLMFSSSQGVVNGPIGLVNADINGDGKMDLICANQVASSLTLLTNNGSGDFTLSATLILVSNLLYAVAADVNGDGKVDLIAASQDPSSGLSVISVFTNNGTGVFTLASQLPNIINEPVSMTTADIHGDGKVDLVAASYPSLGVNGRLIIYTNNGSGVFAPDSKSTVTNFPVSPFPYSPDHVVAVDVNGDGKVDLLTSSTATNTLIVFTNNGNGIFLRDDHNQLAAGSGNDKVVSFIAADLTGDGKPDLITANNNYNAGYGSLSLFTNNGSGYFRQGFTSTTIALGLGFAYSDSVVAADVNRDGRADLIFLTGNNSQMVLTNGGGGKFTKDYILSPGYALGQPVVTDVNGDGAIDLIGANYGGNSLAVFLNTPKSVSAAFNGSIGNLQPSSLVTNGASGVNLTGTFSGNGSGVTNVDLTRINSQGALAFSFGTNKLVLSGASSLISGTGPDSVVSVDVNGDGKLDLVSANSSAGTLSVFTNNGSGGFVLSSTVAAGGTGSICVQTADINGDGYPDLICANRSPGLISVLTNDTTGSFVVSQSVSTFPSFPNWVVAADLNGDGNLALITANALTNTLTVYTNDINGAYFRSANLTVGREPVFVLVSDVNKDGRPDLVSANVVSNSLSVLINNGAGRFTLASSPTVPAPYSIAAADITGNGWVDLICVSSSGNYVGLLPASGLNGIYGSPTLPPIPVPVGNSPRSVTAADINGDGYVDLLCANYNDNTITILTNHNNAGFGVAATPSVGVNPRQLITADLNGDGNLEFITANFGDNTVSIIKNSRVVTTTTTFNGNGAGLTNISLSALPTAVVINNETGVTLSGTFSGNGAGLTNISLSALPAAVVINNATGVTLSGTFSGSGAGLTSLNAVNLTGAVPVASLTSVPAANLTGSVDDARLSANVALLNASQTFTGSNNFNSTGITGQNTLQFGVGLAGQEPNAGKIAYEKFTSDALDIVGAGTNGAARKIKFWAEGGATFAGNVSAPAFVGSGSGLTGVAQLITSQNFTGASNSFMGNLGVGTASPIAPLHVSSSGLPAAVIDSSSTFGTWADLRNTSAGGTNWLIISTGSGNGGGAGNLLFQPGVAPNSTSASALTLLPGGGATISGTATATEVKVANGQFYASAAENPLRIVRGIVQANGSIFNGSGFTVNHSGAGTYVITFTTSFTDAPAVSVLTSSFSANWTSLAAGSVTIQTYGAVGVATDQQFSFIAIGGR